MNDAFGNFLNETLAMITTTSNQMKYFKRSQDISLIWSHQSDICRMAVINSMFVLDLIAILIFY